MNKFSSRMKMVYRIQALKVDGFHFMPSDQLRWICLAQSVLRFYFVATLLIKHRPEVPKTSMMALS